MDVCSSERTQQISRSGWLCSNSDTGLKNSHVTRGITTGDCIDTESLQQWLCCNYGWFVEGGWVSSSLQASKCVKTHIHTHTNLSFWLSDYSQWEKSGRKRQQGNLLGDWNHMPSPPPSPLPPPWTFVEWFHYISCFQTGLWGILRALRTQQILLTMKNLVPNNKYLKTVISFVYWFC